MLTIERIFGLGYAFKKVVTQFLCGICQSLGDMAIRNSRIFNRNIVNGRTLISYSGVVYDAIKRFRIVDFPLPEPPTRA